MSIIHLLSRQFLDGNCACTIEFDGHGQYLWVCPVGVAKGLYGVAMIPDSNVKKLEPMEDDFVYGVKGGRYLLADFSCAGADLGGGGGGGGYNAPINCMPHLPLLGQYLGHTWGFNHESHPEGRTLILIIRCYSLW